MPACTAAPGGCERLASMCPPAGVGGQDDNDAECASNSQSVRGFLYAFATKPNTYCELAGGG